MTKDKITVYLTRNIAAVSLVAIIAMMSSIANYYNCDLVQALQRTFVYNIMTFLYLLILCSLNYFIFEFFKIIVDNNKDLSSYKGIVVFVVLAFIFRILPIHPLFQYNFFYLSLLGVVRTIKQLYKKKIT